MKGFDLSDQPKQTELRRASGAPSIISSEVLIRGTILSTGDLQIEGRVEGDIRAFLLVVSEKSVVVGDVFAQDAVVHGRVEGNICARKVQLRDTCHVVGNILQETLAMEAGAFFEGSCRHSDNPLADAPDLNAPSRPSATAQVGAPSGAAAAPSRPAGGDGHPRPAANLVSLKN